MTRDPGQHAENDLEEALRDLGARLAYPLPGPELALAVGVRVRAAGRPAEPERKVLRPVFGPVTRPWQRVAVALAAMVAVLSGMLVISPGAREAVARWLGISGAKLEVVPTLPPVPSRPLGEGLHLGRRVSLAEARFSVSYPVGVPRLPELGVPDEVYLDPRVDEGIVSFVYRARPGYRAATETGAALLVTQFPAEIDQELIEKKLIGAGTTVESVTVDGGQGFWLEGATHNLYFLDPDGIVLEDTVRLAGNVLLWERGDVTFRIEGEISREKALEIAESVSR